MWFTEAKLISFIVTELLENYFFLFANYQEKMALWWQVMCRRKNIILLQNTALQCFSHKLVYIEILKYWLRQHQIGTVVRVKYFTTSAICPHSSRYEASRVPYHSNRIPSQLLNRMLYSTSYNTWLNLHNSRITQCFAKNHNYTNTSKLLTFRIHWFNSKGSISTWRPIVT